MNYIQVVDDIFKQFDGQKFSIKLWDGKNRHYGKGKTSSFTLFIKNSNTVQRLLSQGSLGFGESYMDGSLQIEGNIEAYLKLRHQVKHIRKSWRMVLGKFLSDRKIPKDRKSQISYHYDLGNEFFKLILDNKTMMYSSARYQKGSEALAKAQENKLKLISDWLNLPKKADVLDLGSGWGGFAIYAARIFRWNITGFTLSGKQLEFSKNLIKNNKLENLIAFHERDMTRPLSHKKYDGIVVIEAIEHVGQESLAAFFKELKKALKPGAPLIIQTTGRYLFKRVDRWTLKYVFPGGYIPTKDELFKHAIDAGFTIENFRDDTQDYIYTISEWIRNLEKNQTKIEKMFDPSFFRLWHLWMHGAKVNFELGDMSLFRMKLRSPI